MCRRNCKYSRRFDVKCAVYATQWLASYYEEYSKIMGHENATMQKNIICRNYMLIQLRKVNGTNHVCASIVHFRSSTHK